MRFNMEWLRDWVDIDIDADQLADELTIAGLEVETVLPAAPTLAGVRVAEVRSVGKHPNADRLSLCNVFDGTDAFEVVCGAPNVAAGIKVPFAPVGTELPGGFRIKAAKIRGVASNGMLCSAKELGISDDAEGLLLLDGDASPGEPLESHLRLPDAVIDVDLTPNRGDCFSILGIAREVAARKSLPLRENRVETVAADHDEIRRAVLDAPEDCPVFATRVIRGISTRARSPDWMKERLRRAGLRPISPIVDVTNYVMLELGQPLHAYDLSRLTGDIRARRASASESLTLLDGSEIELSDDVLVIADDSGAIGLAGIMGGATTAIDDDTGDILLESAFFSPAIVQGRARRYGMHTDASVRFERGVDPTGQARALERATALLTAIAGGAAGPVTVTSSARHTPERRPVPLRQTRLQRVLGLSPPAADIEGWLERLGMNPEATDDGWTVTPPSHRFDIEIEEDLIEEIGRMAGYDTIPPTPALAAVHLGSSTESHVSLDDVADLLVARGYDEIVSYSFISPDAEAAIDAAHTANAPRLANPISTELSVMRSSLWPGLIRAATQNLSRQQARCRLFEIGTVFATDSDAVRESTLVAGISVGPLAPEHWDGESRPADFFDVKADVASLLDSTGRETEFEFTTGNHPALNPNFCAAVTCREERVGYIGALHPRLQREFDIRQDVLLFELVGESAFRAQVPTFRAYSRFPFVRRDLAVVVDESVPAGELKKLVADELGGVLRRTIVFDLYRSEALGTGRKSLGIGLILQDVSRTLTDADADEMLAAATRRLERDLGATIRT